MSDHKDAHLAVEHPECDIGDLWAYHRYPDPADPRPETARVVLVMTLNAGEVGLIHHGPYGDRNRELVTTVPKRLVSTLEDPTIVHEGGNLARGDHRRELTPHLRFHPDAVYEFRIAKPNTDGSLEAAISFKVLFDGEGGVPPDSTEPQRQSIQVLKAVAADGDHVERGDRSGTEVDFGDMFPLTATTSDRQDTVTGYCSPGDIAVFAGPRQDPFTFDFSSVRTLTANQYRKELCGITPSGGSSDAFSRAFNISAIVLEVPIQEILTDKEIAAGMTFGVWSATTLDGHPINRAGWPLYKPTFLPKHDFYGILDPTNGTKLADQVGVLTPLVTEALERLEVPEPTRAELVDMVVPDAMPIDVARPAGLTEDPPNGRTLDASGDPAHFFITRMVPDAYDGWSPPPNKPDPLPIGAEFPYLTPPSAALDPDRSPGWTDFTPIPDPPWPSRTDSWDHPDSCDDYQLSLVDPTVRQAGKRPLPTG